MKIVINDDFGGFGLSPFAYKELLRRKGQEAYFYKQVKYSFSDGEDVYERIDGEVKNELFIRCVNKDHGVHTNDFEDGTLVCFRDNVREDADLIAIIEEYGSKKCSGMCSSLKVVEIPDDVQWEIDEYDGLESIHEVHRVWY